MNDISWDLSKQIDPAAVAVYADVCKPVQGAGCECLVVGATARDIMLRYHGVPVLRATVDIDFGIRVASWDKYDHLVKSLIASGEFSACPTPHRLMHSSGMPVDIVPFGAVADKNNNISWPPNFSSTMSVLGFEDAYRCAQSVQLRASPKLEMQFATPVGLSILKLISWSDNPSARKKDAQDLIHLVHWYLMLGNQERLLEQHADITAQPGFDTFRGGARLLGRDISAAVSPVTKKALIDLLNEQTSPKSNYRLIEDMLSPPSEEFSFEQLMNVLNDLKEELKRRGSSK